MKLTEEPGKGSGSDVAELEFRSLESQIKRALNAYQTTCDPERRSALLRGVLDVAQAAVKKNPGHRLLLLDTIRAVMVSVLKSHDDEERVLSLKGQLAQKEGVSDLLLDFHSAAAARRRRVLEKQ